MKYRLLISGKAVSAIDSFFLKMGESFEIMTTSMRYDDIARHIKYFRPHLFVFCLYNEAPEDIKKLLNLRHQQESLAGNDRLLFAVFGSQEDCAEFNRIAVNVSDLTLVKPMNMPEVEAKIMSFLTKHRSLEQEEMRQSQPAFQSGTGSLPPSAASDKSGRKKRILAVDDSLQMLQLLQELLHADYDVSTALNGKAAMKFLENKKVDLILLDYEMPDEKGPDVLAKIRTNAGTRDVPVIFLTGVTERDKIAAALVHKPQGYLLKPIDRNKLLETITKVMEQ